MICNVQWIIVPCWIVWSIPQQENPPVDEFSILDDNDLFPLEQCQKFGDGQRLRPPLPSVLREGRLLHGRDALAEHAAERPVLVFSIALAWPVPERSSSFSEPFDIGSSGQSGTV